MSLGALELRHLRYFAAVAEQRSFRGAALRLHVSQPPLTRQVQQLEALLGVTLLLRRPRGVELTEAGQVFYVEARNILALVDQAASRALLAGQGQIGRLDIGVFGSAMFGAIPRIIQAFRERYPRVEIVLHTLDRPAQLRALRERRITVGFNRFFEAEPDLNWEVIQTERINVALHRTHAHASAAQLGLAQIADAPLILYPRSSRPSFIDHVLRLFQHKGLTPGVVQEVDDVVTAVALVAGRFGVSLVTDSARNLSLPGVVYVPLRAEDRATFELCMIRRNDDDSPLLHEFLAVARELKGSLGRQARAATASPEPAPARRPVRPAARSRR